MKNNKWPFYKLVKLFIIIICTLNTIKAQKREFKSFKDYYVIENVDSLEKAFEGFKISSSDSLNQLINLEMSRIIGSKKFGKNLKDIQRLAQVYRSPLGQNMYYFLDGLFQMKVNNRLDLASTNLLKANKYFETQHDTTGMIRCSFYLIALNISPQNKVIGSIKSAKGYYDKIITLGNASNDDFVKITMFNSIFIYNLRVNKDKDINKSIEGFNGAVKLIKQNPKYNYLLNALYVNIGQLYSEYGRFKEALKYQLESYERLSQSSQKQDVYYIGITLSNLSNTYMNLGDFKIAESYAKKAIAVFEDAKMNQNNILISAYNKLSNIQYQQRNFIAAWETRNIKDSLHESSQVAAQALVLSDLQTKYETEKKENNIKDLQNMQKKSQSRNQVLMWGVGFTLFIIGLVSYFLFRFKKVNEELTILHKSREKLYTIIAHDLRSPVNIIQQYSDIVIYLVKTKQYNRLETTTLQIDQYGKNLSLLLNNLLTWSLNQQGLIKNNSENVKIRKIFNEILPTYRDMIKFNSLELTDEIDDSVISIDSNKFAIIVRNMLDNAIKFSEKNNPVSIRTTTTSDTFSFTITNKSRAATLAQKQAIKEVFESDKDFVIGEKKNLGIGTILVKQYAKIMGAKITFDYDIDCLTIFTFSIPLTNNKT
jgi:signal transduction histidine kinase